MTVLDLKGAFYSIETVEEGNYKRHLNLWGKFMNGIAWSWAIRTPFGFCKESWIKYLEI